MAGKPSCAAGHRSSKWHRTGEHRFLYCKSSRPGHIATIALMIWLCGHGTSVRQPIVHTAKVSVALLLSLEPAWQYVVMIFDLLVLFENTLEPCD